MESFLFLGLDLAWGRKNTSGGCALYFDGQAASVVDVVETLGPDDEIIGWIEKWDEFTGQGGLLIGVDAPLLVPNATSERPCEGEIRRRFARFHGGAHPANRRLFHDDVRGERLVKRLALNDIAHDPFLTAARGAGLRRVMEVFPHPAHLIFFALTRTLKYKAKPGRDYFGRWAAFQQYGHFLRALTAHDPPLRLREEWPRADVIGLRGSALKRYEDGLDALTCAYIVYSYWWHGMAGAEVIGDLTSGYIVVPRQVCSEKK